MAAPLPVFFCFSPSFRFLILWWDSIPDISLGVPLLQVWHTVQTYALCRRLLYVPNICGLAVVCCDLVYLLALVCLDLLCHLPAIRPQHLTAYASSDLI
jgi:hypothetical protein